MLQISFSSFKTTRLTNPITIIQLGLDTVSIYWRITRQLSYHTLQQEFTYKFINPSM